MSRVWLTPPWGEGAPVEVEATPEILTPLLVAGYSQCAPAAPVKQEENENVGH
jgi:hypothetical protein